MPDASTLSRKAVLVTGASAGIGWETALAFAGKGASVVATARRESRLRELCDLIVARGGKAVYFAGDAADEATAQPVRRPRHQKVRPPGHPDQQRRRRQLQEPHRHLRRRVRRLMDSNMKSSFLFTRHAVPVMIAAERRRDPLHLLRRRPAGIRRRGRLLRHQVRPDRLRPGPRWRAAQAWHQGRDHLPRRRQDRVRPRQGPHRGRRPALPHDGAQGGRRGHPLRLQPARQLPHPPDDRPPHGRTRPLTPPHIAEINRLFQAKTPQNTSPKAPASFPSIRVCLLPPRDNR